MIVFPVRGAEGFGFLGLLLWRLVCFGLIVSCFGVACGWACCYNRFGQFGAGLVVAGWLLFGDLVGCGVSRSAGLGFVVGVIQFLGGFGFGLILCGF